mgnify:CR=1 FL=1
MSAKIIRLLPHFNNYHLRLINLRLLPPPVTYPMPSECEWNRPGDLIDTPVEYKTTPTTPDS